MTVSPDRPPAELVAHPRPPLRGAKLRRTRVMLVMATVVVGVGTSIGIASGRGPWTTGLIGWAAILVAVALGAGWDNVAGIVGLGPRVERWRRRPADGPRNDADWS